jgi:hypothetical protein
VSTLGSAASQWSPRPPTRQTRRRLLVGAVTAAAVSAGTFAVILLAHRSLSTAGPASAASAASAASPATAAVATMSDAGIRWPASVATASAPDAAVAVQLDASVPAAKPAARPPVEIGALAIYVAPFAQVWVDDASVSVGQTPLHLKLRVGRHRIRLANVRLQKEITVPVIITAGKETVIDETW